MKIKRRTKILIGLVTLCAASLSFAAACSSWDTPFDRADGEGKTASVRYDINGGQFASADNRSIIDAFKLEDAQKGVKLAEPGSPERGKGQNTSTASRSGYFLAGWYRERTEVKDGSGNVLDEDGNVWVEGKQKKYTYSGKWNFDTDLFKVQSASTSSEQSLTLYAAWIPNFNFNFLSKNSSGEWEQVAQRTINPLTQSQELELPHWEEGQAAMTYGDFPQITGKTFESLYLDDKMTVKAESTVTHTGVVDYVTGTAVNRNVNFYLTLLEGTWFRIYSAEQLNANAAPDACYELLADLTFDSETKWDASFSSGVFSGKFIGNGHKISGLDIEQVNPNQLRGGIFGRLAAGAEIRDVTFENVSYKLDAATRFTGGEFGLFAGSMDAQAIISGVTVTGTMHIGDIVPTYSSYTVGLLCSNADSLDLSGKLTHTIGLELDSLSAEEANYPHKVTVSKDGILTFTANEDKTKKPEIIYD